MNKDSNQMWFVTSTRFLASIIAALALMFGPDGVVTGPEIYTGLLALSAAFVGLRTIHNAEDIAKKSLPTPEI